MPEGKGAGAGGLKPAHVTALFGAIGFAGTDERLPRRRLRLGPARCQPCPKPAPVERSNVERHIYSVDAAVTHVLMEADQDLHVVLEDGPTHMVAESPNAPFSTVGATAYRRKQMLAARSKVRICSQTRIVGVVFWDRPHNVTGRAPNSIALHPILDFACFS